MKRRAKVCVVGAGPAGLAFALEYARHYSRDLVIVEAGPEAAERSCKVLERRGCRRADPCQMISGIGGAAALSGGKLSEYPAGRGLARLAGDEVRASDAIRWARLMLSRYVELSTPSYLDDDLATIGSKFSSAGFTFRHYVASKYSQDALQTAWAEMAAELRTDGVTIATGTRAEKVVRSHDGALQVHWASRAATGVIEVDAMVIASGRTGEAILASLGLDVGVEPAPPRHIDVGVRLEFPADLWPDMDRAHNDLKLHFDGARTFCACKNGWLTPYRYRDVMLLEGRADASAASALSNIGVHVRVPTNGDATSVIEFVIAALRNEHRSGMTVRQSLDSFLEATPSHHAEDLPSSSISYWRWGTIRNLFPPDIASMLAAAVSRFVDEVLPTAAHPMTSVYGPELDYFWPVLRVTAGMRTAAPGVWAVGDACGEFRGILQAMASAQIAAHDVAAAVTSSTAEDHALRP